MTDINSPWHFPLELHLGRLHSARLRQQRSINAFPQICLDHPNLLSIFNYVHISSNWYYFNDSFLVYEKPYPWIILSGRRHSVIMQHYLPRQNDPRRPILHVHCSIWRIVPSLIRSNCRKLRYIDRLTNEQSAAAQKPQKCSSQFKRIVNLSECTIHSDFELGLHEARILHRRCFFFIWLRSSFNQNPEHLWQNANVFTDERKKTLIFLCSSEWKKGKRQKSLWNIEQFCSWL